MKLAIAWGDTPGLIHGFSEIHMSEVKFPPFVDPFLDGRLLADGWAGPHLFRLQISIFEDILQFYSRILSKSPSFPSNVGKRISSTTHV